MRRSLTGVVLLVVALLIAGPVAGARTTTSSPKPSKARPVPIDVASVERKLTQIARDKAKGIGITVGKASCPKGVKADRAVFAFQCTIPYEGLQAPYVVTLDTTTMHYDIEPVQAILVTSLLASFVRRNLDGDPAAVAASKIDCGKGKILLRPAGSTVECRVTTSARTTIVILKAVDVMGRVQITGNTPAK